MGTGWSSTICPKPVEGFFDDLAANSLLFEPPNGRTPKLTLQTPSVAFDVHLTLTLQRDGDEVVETLVAETETPAAVLSQLRILTGPALGRPDLRWTVRAEGDTEPTGLSDSSVGIIDRDGEGAYTINLSGRELRGRQLVGRRRYPIPSEMRLRLPSLPEAASQDAEVLVGPGLNVRGLDPSVLRVPLGPSTETSATKLRYDAVDQPFVTVGGLGRDPGVTMVWREQIEVIASSHGTDAVTATYQVTSANPIEIDYPADLRLRGLHRNGEPVDLLSIPQRPIRLPASEESGPETIRVVWNRTEVSEHPLRRCVIPEPEISGAVLKSDYSLTASADSFAPALIWRSTVDRRDGRGHGVSSVVVNPGDRVILSRRDAAIAIGWLAALMVFAAAWSAARRVPVGVAAAAVVAAAAAALWLPWNVVIIGWILVPSLVAGLLVTATARLARRRDGFVDAAGDHSGSGWQKSSAGSGSRPGSAASPLLVFWVLTWLPALQPAAASAQSGPAPQSGVANEAGSSETVDLLVPVDKQGRMQGDKVYVPESVHGELFGSRRTETIQPARFINAEYRVELSSPRTTDNDDEFGSDLVVEAAFTIAVDGPAARVSLPIDPDSIRRIERIQPDSSRLVPFHSGPAGGVTVSVRPEQQFELRVTLLPQVTADQSLVELRVDLPVVSSARATVEADRGVDHVEIPVAGGLTSIDRELRRWRAELGPTDQLVVRYRASGRGPSPDGDPLGRRYWIHVGKRQTVFECEIVPSIPVPAGEDVQLVVLDRELPQMITSAWQLERSEQLSPSRWLITLSRRGRGDDPIRLMWRRETVYRDEDRETGEASGGMSIPQIIAPASKPNAPAWVAIHRDPDLLLNRSDDAPVEPLAVDQFLNAWTGYRGQIDQSFVALEALPSLIVSGPAPTRVSVRQRHHLHVTQTQLTLRFTAELQRNDVSLDRRTLLLPPRLELMSLRVEGESVDTHPIDSARGREVPLGRLPARETVLIEAVAVAAKRPAGRFHLSRLELWPAAPTQDRYTLTRDIATDVEIVRQPSAPRETVPPFFNSAQALTYGWLPVGTWAFGNEQAAEEIPKPGGVFRSRPKPTRFDTNQLIVLSWDDGRWSMETLIRILSDEIPDYIDVEIPTRWCDDLEVYPSTTWSRQDTTSPQLKVIRIPCDSRETGGGIISIRSQLQNEESGGVSVPAVGVLGVGTRRISVSVPDQLTNETVRWRTSAVAAESLPDSWPEDVIPGGPRSSYSVASEAWSIKLVPLPRVSVEAHATSADMQLFPRDESALMLCRWDLVPAGLDSVEVDLPLGTRCVGAWTAGRAVPIGPSETGPDDVPGAADTDGRATLSRVGSGDETRPQGERLEIPLSLSRLSQPVEILLRLPPVGNARDYRPTLRGIPVEDEWMAIYLPAEASSPEASGRAASATRGQFAPAEVRRRRRGLAASIVEAVQRPIDLLAERPESEVAAWLAPWVERYEQLARSDGHLVDWADVEPGEPESDAEAESKGGGGSKTTAPQRANGGSLPSWDELDRRLAVHVNRFLENRPESESALFAARRFPDFELVSVSRLEDATTPARIPRVDSGTRQFRALLVKSLTLLTVCGILGLLWPMRRPLGDWVMHPAIWLAALGVCGLWVAPLPIAMAVIALAVVIPALNWARQLRRAR